MIEYRLLRSEPITMEEFAEASALMTYEDVSNDCWNNGIEIIPEDITQVMALMTPEQLRTRRLNSPQIMPVDHPLTFDQLLAERENIKNLQLAPIRSEAVQETYTKMDHQIYLQILERHYLRKTQMAVVREMYPSALGTDVQQLVVWIKDDTIADSEVAAFIAKIALLAGSSPENVILFERSRATDNDVSFQKPKTPEYRHIHLWLRTL